MLTTRQERERQSKARSRKELTTRQEREWGVRGKGEGNVALLVAIDVRIVFELLGELFHRGIRIGQAHFG